MLVAVISIANAPEKGCVLLSDECNYANLMNRHQEDNRSANRSAVSDRDAQGN